MTDDVLNRKAPQLSYDAAADSPEEMEESGEERDAVGDSGDVNWMQRARDAYRVSMSFYDANLRKKHEDSINNFNSEHSADSKYRMPGYDKRSKIFRPKIRSVIRKNEAAGAAAFFSNMDVVSIEALNQANIGQRVSADVMKQLVEYRLTSKNPKRSIPWFQIVMGGLQDAQVTAACARVEWLYDEGTGEDKPEVELFPVENLRFDPAANWIDPVNSSPYLIHEFPMWVVDVRSRMVRPDKNGNTWKELDDAVIRRAKKDGDTTSLVRQNSGLQSSLRDGGGISDYEVVWIQRHIHRYEGRDWHFYTLADLEMLTDPEPLEDVVFHGERPYIIGVANLETHKPLPNPLPQLAKGLTEEGNEITNQRLDNVKFVLNKGYIVARGKNVDLSALVRNVPGRIILADNPKEHVVEESWPDVTGSAFEELNRINQDSDELLGNFSPMNVPNRKGAETVKGMAMLEKPSSMLTEYLLRTYSETFVEPVLRHIIKLEQHYETDETVMALAAEKAEVYRKYGQEPNWNEMVQHDLIVKVNVGMGATDPSQKLNRFIMGVQAGANIQKMMVPGLQMDEVWKEIFAHTGYQDGARFFGGNDPEKMRMGKQLQDLMKMLQMAHKQLKDKEGANQAKIKTAQINQMGAYAREQLKQGHENKRLFAEIVNDRVTTANEPEPEQKVNSGTGR